MPVCGRVSASAFLNSWLRNDDQLVQLDVDVRGRSVRVAQRDIYITRQRYIPLPVQGDGVMILEPGKWKWSTIDGVVIPILTSTIPC